MLLSNSWIRPELASYMNASVISGSENMLIFFVQFDLLEKFCIDWIVQN